MKKILVFPLVLMLSVLSIELVSAHCPLCTIGAGAAAAGAVYLGVSAVIVALFIGGFGMSMGMWFARAVKKKYVPFQKTIIILGSFFLTVIPILPIIGVNYYGFYLNLMGSYGNIFNKTYLINLSLVSSMFGGLLVFISPKLNKKITEKTGKKLIPFQGVVLTLLLLLVVSVIMQFSFASANTSMQIGSINKVSPDEFDSIIQNESVFLLNTHTPYQGEIEGTDLIIEDWENIEKYMDQLPPDVSTPIAVYCRSGHMSGIVAEELKKMGYKVYDLDGGMNAWKESGRNLNEN